MDLLCFCSVLCLLCLCARLFICALWSPAGKGLTSWLSFVVSYCEFVTFPLVVLGQVWYLIVSIPDLCTLTYYEIYMTENLNLRHFIFMPISIFFLKKKVLSSIRLGWIIVGLLTFKSNNRLKHWLVFALNNTAEREDICYALP